MKHFTHFKSSILRGLLSLFFLTAMVSSAWGENVTLDIAGTSKWTNKSVSKDGVTMTITSGSLDNSSTQTRLNSEAAFTITAPSNKKVVSANITTNSTNTYVAPLSSDISTYSGSTCSVSGTTATITVSSGYKSIICTNLGGAIRITSCVVTIEDDDTSGSSTPTTVTAPTLSVFAGTYTENKTVKVSNYSSNYLYAYTTDGSDPAIDTELNVTNGTEYDNDEGINITSSCTLKIIAADENGKTSSVTSAAYTINVFTSLEDLVAADITSGTLVTVSFEDIPIKSFFTTSGGSKNGIYFDIQKGGKDIEIYYQNVPEEWVAGGTVSGTMTCPWKLYSGTWELAPSKNTWAWTNLTYNAPISKILSSVTLDGKPTKTTYIAGEEFDPTGITVTANYSDGTNENVTSSASFYGITEALSAGQTSFETYASFNGVDSPKQNYSITVNKKASTITIANMELGKTDVDVAIVAETTPAGAPLTYTIASGSEYVSLSDGKLSAITPGVATVKAEYTGNDEYESAEVTFSVTVTDLQKATIGSFSAISGGINSDISFEAFKGNAGTAPAIISNNLRLYQNGGYIAISGIKGVKIQSVTLTTGSTYVSTTVGYCVDDNDAPTTGEAVAKESEYSINGLNNQNVKIYCLGTDKDTRLDIASLTVKYSKEKVTLSSISVSGDYVTSFIKNTEFNHVGAVVTATFSDGDEQVITSSAVFSEPDMTTTGEKTITVSYTHEDVTKSTSYNITISEEIVTSIALSGTYTKVFKTTDTFNHDGVVVTASYNSGRNAVVEDAEFSTPDLSTTGSKTVTVAYGGQQETYDIKVIPANTIFYESFDSNDGTGGNDDQWSGSIATNNIASDNTGWTFANAKGANKCSKFGSGSAAGSAKTPSITFSGSAKITFKAAAWNGSSENTTLKLSAPQGTLSQESVTMTKAAWTEYTIYLYGVKGSTQITFAASQASNNRFFLDEVLIEKYVNPISISSAGYATYVTSNALDFSNCDGITAYKVSVNEGAKTVNLSPIIEVPANEAIVVAGEAGTYNVPVIMSATALEDNNLIYSDVSVPVNAENKYYVLAYQNNEVCFAPVVSGSSIGARKGYFTISNGSAANYRIVIEDLENGNETAIPEIDPTGEIPLIIYTMTGIRIPKVVEDGLYIVNGKTKWMLAE